MYNLKLIFPFFLIFNIFLSIILVSCGPVDDMVNEGNKKKDLSSLSLSYDNINGVTNFVIVPVSPMWSANPGGVTYSIKPNLPSGLTLNANTGAITGSPASKQLEASYTITVLVDTTNNSQYRGSNTTTMTITIKSWLSDLSLSYSNLEGIADTNITSVSPEWSVPPDNVRYAITPSLPAGLVFNTHTGEVSGASQVGHSNSHTVVVYSLSNSSFAGSNFTQMKVFIRDHLSSLILSYDDITGPTNFAIAPVLPIWSANPGGVTYSIKPNLPSGLNFNTNAGSITGTSIADHVQTRYTITATADNLGQYVGSKVSTFYITITSDFGCASLSGLMITEVTQDWMEVYNPQSAGSDPVCLENYRIRASTGSGATPINYYSLPNYVVEPQTYAIIRFDGYTGNNASNIMVVKGPGLEQGGQGSGYSGFYEITLSNNSVDFIGFCQSDGSLPTTPVTRSFSGCVQYSGTTYLSFSRSQSLTDTDDAVDWSSSTIPTFGGQNDVTDVTDNDNDGIPDANEMPGTTFAGMPLYDWGARVNQRDIFVHISYMEGSQTNRGLAPPQASLEKVRATFSNNGFTIHIDVGDLYDSRVAPEYFNISGKSHEVPHSTYVTLERKPLVTRDVIGVKSAIEYKNRYMPINRLGIFHHSLFAYLYSYEGSVAYNKGFSELPGNDFIICLGGDQNYNNYTTNVAVNTTAAAFFHELGHNLSLRHGGADDLNYKPNHFSTMNYAYVDLGVPEINNTNENNFHFRYWFQFLIAWDIEYSEISNNIFTTNFKIDYSYGTLPDIDENNLSEINPLGPGIGNVDWNYNGIIETTNYAFNVNPVDRNTGLLLIQDYNEWGNIKLPFEYDDDFNNGYNSFNGVDLSPQNRFQEISSRFEYLREKQSPFVQCNLPGHNH